MIRVFRILHATAAPGLAHCILESAFVQNLRAFIGLMWEGAYENAGVRNSDFR